MFSGKRMFEGENHGLKFIPGIGFETDNMLSDTNRFIMNTIKPCLQTCISRILKLKIMYIYFSIEYIKC